jgi:hypothetical protein
MASSKARQQQQPQQQNKVFRPDVKTLRATGVMVKVNRVRTVERRDDQGEVTQEYHPEGTEQFRIVLANWVMAEIEDRYGSHEAWLDSLSNRPYRTVLDTFVILTGKPDRYVSEMFIGSAIEEYQYAFVTAWTMAYGGSEDAVGKLVSRGNVMGAIKSRLLDAAMEIWASTDESLGAIGLQSGSDSDAITTSSGDEPSPRSDSSSMPSQNNDNSNSSREELAG